MNRRHFMKGAMATVAVAQTGLLTATPSLAKWEQQAYESKTAEDAIQNLFGKQAVKITSGVKFKAPGIAENGLVVPIEIDASARPDIKRIAVIIEENPRPLAFSYSFDQLAFIKTRVKMSKTSNVIAVLETKSGELEKMEREVKVTIGGCGG